jgi:glycosyl transferase, family 25
MRTVVRVISLPSAKERQARFAKTLEAFPQIEWEFFEGGHQTAEGIEYQPERALISQGRTLSEGDVGCFVSHYRVWRSLLASEHQQMLVLEDDVYVDWPAVIPFLSRDLGENLHFLRLYAHRPAISRELGWLCGRRVVQFLHYTYGMQAYLVTREGARRLIAAATPVIDRAIDDFIDRSWDHGIPNLCVFPFPVIELEVPSSIGTVDRYADQKQLTRGEKLQRVRYQISDKLRRLTHAARELSPLASVDRELLQVVTEKRVDSYEYDGGRNSEK